ncbi:complement C1q-like protein 4 [Salvelinus fontinalis]|uniref:complement C1q-like protein 4 n=1 Tax=Salvelinus fontinalis TaxID=8038 RepID=UPI002484F994|nr:complement C1q-like protein 4 [Salvelinus fontinalis]
MGWTGALPCGKWDCECAIKSQPGCCCVANEMSNSKIAFSAEMRSRSDCFGPFTSNVPIRYYFISLNQGNGYNDALGTFIAPRAGLYSLSFTAYSNVGVDGERLYHKVQLMKNNEVVASVWEDNREDTEDNREDTEDSGTQSVLVSLRQGDKVYVELLSGRSLCGNTKEFNRFSGYQVYPFTQE